MLAYIVPAVVTPSKNPISVSEIEVDPNVNVVDVRLLILFIFLDESTIKALDAEQIPSVTPVIADIFNDNPPTVKVLASRLPAIFKLPEILPPERDKYNLFADSIVKPESRTL